jgi:hypothetical protein
MNGDEADSPTLSVLQKIQADIIDVRANTATKSGLEELKGGLEELRTDIGQLRTETKAGLTDVAGVARKTLSEVVALSGRVEHIETGLRVADRLAALERQMAEIQRRLGS